MKVTIYIVAFKGTYGRNRTIKSSYSSNLVRHHGHSFSPGEARDLAAKHLADIKAKDGVVRVTRYQDSEESRYAGGDGKDLVTHTVSITEGETIYSGRVGL